MPLFARCRFIFSGKNNGLTPDFRAVLNPGLPRPDDVMPFRESGKDVVGMLINRDSLRRYTANQLRVG